MRAHTRMRTRAHIETGGELETPDRATKQRHGRHPGDYLSHSLNTRTQRVFGKQAILLLLFFVMITTASVLSQWKIPKNDQWREASLR